MAASMAGAGELVSARAACRASPAILRATLDNSASGVAMALLGPFAGASAGDPLEFSQDPFDGGRLRCEVRAARARGAAAGRLPFAPPPIVHPLLSLSTAE